MDNDDHRIRAGVARALQNPRLPIDVVFLEKTFFTFQTLARESDFMKLVCPCCGATLSIEALLQDGDARAAVQAALSLPGQLGGLILRYIALFRSESRALSWNRVAKLLTELNDQVSAREVSRGGIVYTAPLELWQAAIEEMLTKRDKLQLPLKTHGYLFEVIAGMAGKAAGTAERKREDKLRQPREGAGNGPERISEKALRVRGERPQEWQQIKNKHGSKT
jgi:hypothetical protein